MRNSFRKMKKFLLIALALIVAIAAYNIHIGIKRFDEEEAIKEKNFVLNGVKFKIPKGYLMFGNTKDGVTEDNIGLVMKYPDFGPKTRGMNRNNIITIIVQPKYSAEQCKERGMKSGNYFPQSCTHPDMAAYFIYLGVPEYLDGKNQQFLSGVKKVKEHKDIGLTEYAKPTITPHGNHIHVSNVLIKGNLLKPNFWLGCPYTNRTQEDGSLDWKSTRCERLFDLNDKIEINYSIQGEEIPHYEEIEKGITKRLNSFIQQ